MENSTLTAYRNAEKRVRKIRGFYEHLTVYLLLNAIIVTEGLWGIEILKTSVTEADPAFLEWLFLNVLSVPVLWGIVLLVHGMVVFIPEHKAFRRWEERMLVKALKEENWRDFS